MTQRKKRSKRPVSRKAAVSVLIATLVPALFISVLLVAFGYGWALPFVLLALILAAGILHKSRPDFFAALKIKKKKGDDPGAVEPPRPTSPSGSSRRSYMMLVPLSHMSSHQITINSSPFVIGRDQDSDFCIPDNYVSGRHLVIDYYEGEGLCYATDVSTYGSYLNSVRMPTNTPQPLHQSDTLQIAGLMFRVEYVHF